MTEKTMKDDMLPCPFCGAKPEVVEQLDGFVIRCSNRNGCPILPQTHHFQYSAIRSFSFNWNTRAAELVSESYIMNKEERAVLSKALRLKHKEN